MIPHPAHHSLTDNPLHFTDLHWQYPHLHFLEKLEFKFSKWDLLCHKSGDGARVPVVERLLLEPLPFWRFSLYIKAESEPKLRPGMVFMRLFACGWLPTACVFRVFDQLAIPV